MKLYRLQRRPGTMCMGAMAVVCFAGALAYGGEPTSAELARQVTIRRTAYGVPHITAATERALGFGFGYCQAEDHLLNIARRILQARGEMASFFGGERNIESDFRSKQFRVYARATETYHLLDADFRELTEGFAAGLNFYIERHRSDLPDYVRPVTPHDLAAHGLSGVMRFAFNRRNIIKRFKDSLESETAMIPAPEDEDAMGSNMWAFAPSRTTSGRAILMGNPHQAWSEVATYYEAHLTIPGKLNFYGSTFVGRPVLTTGFNDHLGWSHTVNYPDLEEIYELTLDPADPNRYLFDGGTVAIRSEEAEVNIKDDEGMRSERRTFEHTPLGPVIHRATGKIYVLKSVTHEDYRFYQQWYRLAQSKSYEEFRRALDIQSIPMFNICYADREGNIFYLWNGTVPALPHASHGGEAVAAARSSEIWTRVHPVDELPQLLNPKGGYVQNSNDPPYFTNLHEPLDIEEFPPHFPRHRLGLRTQHSLELVHNDKKFSLEQVRDMKFSQKMLLADRVKDDLISALESSGPAGEIKAAIELLRAWDNSVSAESRASVLFEIWWLRYAMEGRRLRDDAYAVAWTPEQPVTTPHGLGNTARATEAFAWALEETAKRYGSWDVAWGDVHRIRMGDVDLPLGGGSGALGCFRVLSFRTDKVDGKQIVRSGDSWIFAVEFGPAGPSAYTVIGYSESEVEGSPHFSDQAALYAGNTMKRAAFSEAEIEGQLLTTYHPGAERGSRDLPSGGR